MTEDKSRREEIARIAAALRVMAASERAQADRVQGPSFKGSQWGADIIEGHHTRADILSDAVDLLVAPPAPDDLVKHMVDRFLGWRLPEDFKPDCGIQFDADAAKKLNPRNARYDPVGTNLFSATQATAMVKYMIDGLSLRSPDLEVEGLGERALKDAKWLEAFVAPSAATRLAHKSLEYVGWFDGGCGENGDQRDHQMTFLHPLAHIEPDCSIGDGTRIYQFASITRKAILGRDCTIAPHVSLDGCILGDRCIARPSVDIGPGIICGDDVFLGPLVCLANDLWPSTDKEGFDYEALWTGGKKVIVIEDGVTLGAHVVVVPGVRIGAGAFICANATVTRDVPAGKMLLRDGTLVDKPENWRERRMKYVRDL